MIAHPAEADAALLMLGVGGSGMKNLAYLLQAAGWQVLGTDAYLEGLIDQPTLAGVRLLAEAAVLSDFPLVQATVYSDALANDHPLLVASRARGIETLLYSEVIQHMAGARQLVAVAGTHGKSSTAAMLAHILIHGQQDPTVLLGAGLPAWQGRGARAGGGHLFIVEADEYRNHFLALQPQHVVITSIDFDHPDYFSSLSAVRRSFNNFLERTPADGWVVTSGDVLEEHSMLSWPERTVAAPKLETSAQLPVIGEHMRDNAALAVAMSEQLGIARPKAVEALRDFGGLERRLEELGALKGVPVLSDYGHHPAEINATLQAVREQRADQKLLVLLEVHTLERLLAFFDDFVAALGSADGIVLAPIFTPSGRASRTVVTEDKLGAFKIRLEKHGLTTWRISSEEELRDCLADIVSDFDVLVAFSAGALDGQLRKIVNLD